jgi:fatty-acyl-CoA synthase
MSEFRHVYRTELSPLSFLTRSAYVFPDKTAVVHGARRYTYRQLEERVNRLASALRAAGLEKHDRVAFLCPNIPPMLEAHYGVPAAGGVLVAINTRLSSDEIGYILEHSGARFLFVDAELEPLVTPLPRSGRRIVPRRRRCWPTRRPWFPCRSPRQAGRWRHGTTVRRLH